MNEHLDVKIFESNNTNIQLISTIGSGEWKVELYLNKDDDRYYAKGPFARWDSICYVLLEKITTAQEAEEWIEKMKSNQ